MLIHTLPAEKGRCWKLSISDSRRWNQDSSASDSKPGAVDCTSEVCKVIKAAILGWLSGGHHLACAALTLTQSFVFCLSD